MNDKNEAMLSTMDFMLKNMEIIKKQVELHAVLSRSAYNNLVATGFSEEQALDLIKALGPMLSK